MDPLGKLTGQKYDREEALRQVMMSIKKLWRLSGYDIPEEAQDHCCKNTGAISKMGNMLGFGGGKADSEHEDHKEMFKCLDSKEMEVYRGW